MLLYQKSISARKLVLISPENQSEHQINSSNEIYTVDESCFGTNSTCKFKVLFQMNIFDKQPSWLKYFWPESLENHSNEIIADFDSADYFFREVLVVISLTFALMLLVWLGFKQTFQHLFSLNFKNQVEN